MSRGLIAVIGVAALLSSCSLGLDQEVLQSGSASSAVSSGSGAGTGAGAGGGAGSSSGSAGGGGTPPGSVTLSFGEQPGTDVAGVTSDTQLSLGDPTHNWGAAQFGWIDIDAFADPERVFLLRFDLQAIPTTAVVQAAELTVYTTAHMNAGSPDSVELYEVLEAWNEGTMDGAPGTASWNERVTGVTWTAAGVGPGSRDPLVLASIMSSVPNAGYSVDLPVPVVQRWVQSAADNHGLVIATGSDDAMCFATREHPIALQRPLLTVTYVP